VKKVKRAGHGFASFEHYRPSGTAPCRRRHLAVTTEAAEDPIDLSPLRRVEPANPALATSFLLAATTGARRGQLSALCGRAVDIEDGCAQPPAIAHGGSRRSFPLLAPTKLQHSHRVALDDACLTALTALHREVRRR